VSEEYKRTPSRPRDRGGLERFPAGRWAPRHFGALLAVVQGVVVVLLTVVHVGVLVVVHLGVKPAAARCRAAWRPLTFLPWPVDVCGA